MRVLDDFSTGSLDNLPRAGAPGADLEVIRGDVRDLPAVERAARGATAIFHQAAMRSVPRSVADPLGANDHNVTGTLHVFEAARRAGVRRVVYASSSSVYGDRSQRDGDGVSARVGDDDVEMAVVVGIRDGHSVREGPGRKVRLRRAAPTRCRLRC